MTTELSLNQKIDLLLHRTAHIEDIKTEMEVIKKNINDFSTKINSNDSKIASINEHIKIQKDTIYLLEKRLKKKNLIFIGLPEKESSKADLENIVLDVFKKYINPNYSNPDIDEAFRLGRKSDKMRPILVTFSSIKTRDAILANRTKFKGSKIFVNGDLPTEERQLHQKLLSEAKILRNEGKKVRVSNKGITIITDKRGRDSSDSSTPDKLNQPQKIPKQDLLGKEKNLGTMNQSTLNTFLCPPLTQLS